MTINEGVAFAVWGVVAISLACGAAIACKDDIAGTLVCSLLALCWPAFAMCLLLVSPAILSVGIGRAIVYLSRGRN